MGSVRPVRRTQPGRLVAARTRNLCRHHQPRLLPGEARALAARRTDAGARPRRPARAGPREQDLMAWSGIGLLTLVEACIASTGVPAFLVLLAAASAGA